MASTAALGPYSRALALGSKAFELLQRGHTERSDDKLREALASARAVGTEDCLVTAFLAVRVAERGIHSFIDLSNERLERPSAPLDTASDTAKLREFAEALAGAAAVARRRRALGAHQPAEQAWHEAYVAAIGSVVQGCSQSKALEKAKGSASLISSDTTVFAACTALHVLEVATHFDLFSASELSSRLGSACDLIDEAVALARPQRVNDTSSGGYTTLLRKRLQDGVGLCRQHSFTAAHSERLEEALKQLSLHGGINAAEEARIDQGVKDLGAKRVAAESAASAPELRRSCALASCGALEAHVKHFSRCAACKTVVYCSKTCQLADWPAHKKACKAARNAADEAKATRNAA